MSAMNITISNTICERCEEEIVHECDEYSVHTTRGWEVWCQPCVARHATYCEHCETYRNDDDYTFEVVKTGYGRTELWCNECVNTDARQCADCGDYFAIDDFGGRYEVWDRGDVWLCEDCSDAYGRCYRCDCLVMAEDADYDGWDYCCPNHSPNRGEHISEYNHTYGSFFWQDDGSCKYEYELDDDNKLYLGIELEVTRCDSRAALADAIYDDGMLGDMKFCCKEDCTINTNPNDGVEIVSQPMTPLYHLNSGVWERIVELAYNENARSHDGGLCGLHMHVSRNALHGGEDTVYRIDRLMHHFKNELIRFSRRESFGWCRITDDSDIVCHKNIADRKYAWKVRKHRLEGHDVALNDSNDATVEYRLWRGTLNIETLRATIELTTGMTIIADRMSDEMADGLTWTMFKLLVRYALEAEGIPHDDLDSYLIRRGL